MAILYISSVERFSGKSSFCFGIGKKFRQEGLKVGYIKPVSTTAHQENGEIVDDDASFFKRYFQMPQPLSEIVPIALTPNLVEAILTGKTRENFEEKLKKACSDCAKDKDLILLEGAGTLREGHIAGLSAPKVTRILNAPALVIIKYMSDLGVVDDALTARARLEDRLLGVVINMVPRPRMQYVEEVVCPYLEAQGVKVFGVLPHERILASITVKELVEVLDGEILCCPEKTDELVEYVMVGAMSVDLALSYFRRRPNKVVITGGDRPDIQLAALETSTKCVVLTGNIRPSPIILSRAEEVGVPMIVVRHDTFTSVELVENYFGRSRFYQEKKVARFEELLNERFNFSLLRSSLGI